MKPCDLLQAVEEPEAKEDFVEFEKQDEKELAMKLLSDVE